MSSSIPIFDGTSDVAAWWCLGVKAKLVAKGYKAQLKDVNMPAAADLRLAWQNLADKALGIIITQLHPDVAMQFENLLASP